MGYTQAPSNPNQNQNLTIDEKRQTQIDIANNSIAESIARIYNLSSALNQIFHKITMAPPTPTSPPNRDSAATPIQPTLSNNCRELAEAVSNIESVIGQFYT